MNWRDWKVFKRQVAPKKRVSELFDYISLGIQEQTPPLYSIGQKVFAWDDECRHFHKGEVLNIQKELQVMYPEAQCKQMGFVSPKDVLLLNSSDYDAFKNVSSQWSLDFVKNVNMKALAFIFKLLELKFLHLQKLGEILSGGEGGEMMEKDSLYYSRNIEFMD